jgi:hypothetical protein
VSAEQGIPVLSFRAHDLYLALAADHIEQFIGVNEGVVHVAELLGMPLPEAQTSRRTLRLRAGHRVGHVAVDGPVHMETVTGSSFWSAPKIPPLARLSPVMGFLKKGQGIALLLDARALLDRLLLPPEGVRP